MSVKILRRLYHAGWYIVATIILSTAVMVTFIRLFLPHINDYRVQIENWASDYSGYAIRIQKLDAEWQGWTPLLSLQGIEVLDPSGQTPVVQLDSATVSLNPLLSFMLRKLSPLSITINGPEFNVVRGTDGAINFIQPGLDAAAGNEYPNKSALAEWLLLQESISIKGARVTYVDSNRPGTSLLLSDVALSFRKSWDHRQFNLTAKLPRELGDMLRLALDIQGDITTPSWSGQIYLSGEDVSPGHLLALAQDHGSSLSLSTAPADIRLWSNWRDGKLERLQGMVDASAIKLEHDNLHYDLKHLQSMFALQRDQAGGFGMKISIKDLITANGAWPETTIDVYKQQFPDSDGFRFAAFSDYLKAEDVLPLIKSAWSTNIPENHGITLHGIMKNSYLEYSADARDPVYLESDIEKFDMRSEKYNSRISNLSGHIEGGINAGIIKLNTYSATATLPKLFRENLALEEITGDITWSNQNGAIVFTSSLLESHTPHFNASLKGWITISPDQDLPFVNLLFNIADMNLDQMSAYMPLTVHEEVRDWMKKSLIAGQASTVDMVLRGNLSDFPFKEMQGQFKTIASIHDATLDYHPDWVPVDQLEAELIMDNNKFSINGHTGYIHKAEITEVQAVIEDLDADEPLLTIAGHLKGSAGDGLFFIKNSPLSSSSILAELIKHELQGPVTLDLGLDIPLNEAPLTLKGDLFFDQASLKSPELGMELTNVTGNVLFTENEVSSRTLRADYFNEQISLGINTDDQSRLALSLEGDSGGDFIASQLSRFFPDITSAVTSITGLLQGKCHWMATLSPDITVTGTSEGRLLTISSDLSGLAIDLPAPLGKKYDPLPLPLSISTVISSQADQEIHFTYGNQMFGNILLDQTDTLTLSRLELALGSGEKLSNTGEGIIVHGDVNHLSLSDWNEFIHTLGLSETIQPGIPVQIDLRGSLLDYYTTQFADTRFSLDNKTSGWTVTFNGPDLEGEINLPANSTQDKVHATFKKLYLQTSTGTEAEVNVDPIDKPALELTADQFSYNGIELGKLTLNTSRADQGVAINELNFSKSDMTITGKGTWQSVDGQEFSSFKFSLDAEKLESMLDTFDYSVAPIENGPTRLLLDATWQGSPLDFSLAAVNGSMTMDIGKGEFLDFEPETGRLFGLLNLQSLLRFVSLDFSVLFYKEYVFDEITGSFSIEEGNAYTNNLAVKGNSADINLTGRTGLIDKDYDQIATVTPRTLFGPLSMGVEAVKYIAGEKVFEPITEQIDKLIRNQYTIKGSWEEPVVEKYESNGEEGG